jgi:hypothetical protein
MSEPIQTKHSDCFLGYVAWTNSDLTEGRGTEYPLAVCKVQATALRLGTKAYVQGSDCQVTPTMIFQLEGRWYGPIHLELPTVQDEAFQKVLDAKANAIAKAKAAGLTEKEIEAIQK